MGDIFDQVSAQPTGDIFDQVAAQSKPATPDLQGIVGKMMSGNNLTPEETQFAQQQRQANAQNVADKYGKAFGMAAGGGIDDVSRPAVQGVVSKILTPLAKRMYQSALKPGTAAGAQRIASAVQTGLNEGVPVSPAGAEKLGSLIEDVNDKITQTIGQGSGKTVNPYAVTSRLADTAQRFAHQVNPNADLNAISESGQEFLGNNPAAIPAEVAQKMKQGTYLQLRGKYGQLSGATIESQKALARGIKEELVQQFPELANLNAKDSQLYNLDGMLEKAVLRQGSHQLGGIGTPLAMGAAKAVTGSNAATAAAGVIKGTLDNPVIKSRLAISIAKAGNLPLGVAMQKVSSYIAALGGVANSVVPSDRASSPTQ